MLCTKGRHIMRFAFRIDLTNIAPCAALCAAIAVIALPGDVHAQTAQAHFAALANAEFTAPGSSDETKRASTEFSPLVGNVISTPADAASMTDIPLDDQMLSRQRGGAVGMVMVAATPQLLRGDSGGRVTLWDEIAPPSPLPVPVDAARAAQGNVATYQRK
jgi:hypothetical protein